MEGAPAGRVGRQVVLQGGQADAGGDAARLEKQIERLPGLEKWFVTFPAPSSLG
ncbi:MAG: hypothetical protein U0797_24570 [Gemmataceae bacterium]